MAKCPFMSRLIIDSREKLLTKAGDFYTVANSGAITTNFDLTKNIELFNTVTPAYTADVYMLYHDCIEETCQLWDTVNSRCGARVSDTIRGASDEINTLITMLEAVIGKSSERDSANSIVSYLMDILGQSSEKTAAEGTGSSLLKESNHIHGSHYHPREHLCATIPASCGGQASGFSGNVPKAAALVAEYVGNEDLDGNGLIYGIDFYICDADLPPMLEEMPKGGTSYTWLQYLATLP